MRANPSNGGLPAHAAQRMRAVIAAHPAIEQVILFGSRAKGTAKRGSDIDLAVFGPCANDELGKLAWELDDLLLPWEIDLVQFDSITNPDLREHIVRAGIPFTPLKPSVALTHHRDAIRTLVGRFRTANPRVFGSVVHGKDRDGSDIDLLVDPLPGATLFDLGGLQCELEDLLGVSVDLLTPGDLPPGLRTRVLAEARPYMNESRLPGYLDHMMQAAANACRFVDGQSKDDFLADRRTQQAVVMSLVIIGEAATKIMERYPDFVEAHPEVTWPSMRGMRNRIARGYFEINLDVVWETLRTALPELQKQLPSLLDVSGRDA